MLVEPINFSVAFLFALLRLLQAMIPLGHPVPDQTYPDIGRNSDFNGNQAENPL